MEFFRYLFYFEKTSKTLMGLVRDKTCKYANKGDYLDWKKKKS